IVMRQVFDTMSEATGVDLAEIMRANTYEAKVNRNITVNGNLAGAAEKVAVETGSAAAGSVEEITAEAGSAEAVASGAGAAEVADTSN
ncbi:MAG: hypothetical protein Q4F25_00945, partial [Eubacteriales bacterium]|nr:hypothetical protein [Eubacteriales bacterium]